MADRNERCRACGLYCDTWAAQVQLVGDPRGQRVLVVAERNLKFPYLIVACQLIQKLAVLRQICEQVGIQASSGEESDLARILRRDIARIFKRIRARFEEDTMLWVHVVGFAGRDSEVFGIEHRCIFQHTASRHEVRFVKSCAGVPRNDISGCEACDRIFPGDQVFPERTQVRGAGGTGPPSR